MTCWRTGLSVAYRTKLSGEALTSAGLELKEMHRRVQRGREQRQRDGRTTSRLQHRNTRRHRLHPTRTRTSTSTPTTTLRAVTRTRRKAPEIGSKCVPELHIWTQKQSVPGDKWKVPGMWRNWTFHKITAMYRTPKPTTTTAEKPTWQSPPGCGVHRPTLRRRWRAVSW